MKNLKTGDRVRIIDDVEYHAFNIGDIVTYTGRYNEDSDGKLFKLGELSQYLYPHHYEVIEEIELNPGDKAKVIETGSSRNGDRHYFNIGDEIEFVELFDGRYKFTLGNLDQYLEPYQFEVINEDSIQEDGAAKLKIGDKVRVTNVQTNNFKMGDIVSYVGDDLFELDCFTQILYDEDYERVPPITNLKVGDKVKIREDLREFETYGNDDVTSEMAIHAGDIAEIVNDSVYGGKYNINLDGGYWKWTKEMFDLDYEFEEVEEEVDEADFQIEGKNGVRYIYFGNTTIAIPEDTPMGISHKHPEDEYDREIGQALAVFRMNN